jgi:hypothetical protein
VRGRKFFFFSSWCAAAAGAAFLSLNRFGKNRRNTEKSFDAS